MLKLDNSYSQLYCVLLLIGIWLMPSLAYSESGFGIELKGGLNAASLAKDDRVNRYGFTGGGGGCYQWSLRGRFSLAGRIDFLYTPRGAEVIRDGVYLGKSRSHYMDGLIIARPEMRLGWMSTYLLLGGGLSFLTNANIEDASGVKMDITDDLHRVDVALLIGFGAALHLPRRNWGPFYLDTIFLEGRHDHGLLDTDAINGGSKNRTTSLLLGLSLGLSSRTASAGSRPLPSQGEPSALAGHGFSRGKGM
jgi:hypothetical protein